jgi:hypothetical protein
MCSNIPSDLELIVDPSVRFSIRDVYKKVKTKSHEDFKPFYFVVSVSSYINNIASWLCDKSGKAIEYDISKIDESKKLDESMLPPIKSSDSVEADEINLTCVKSAYKTMNCIIRKSDPRIWIEEAYSEHTNVMRYLWDITEYREEQKDFFSLYELKDALREFHTRNKDFFDETSVVSDDFNKIFGGVCSSE